MNIAHTDLKPGDRFRLTIIDDYADTEFKVTTSWEGVVRRVNEEFGYVVAEGGCHLYDSENATWERLAPAEPKNLGAVVEFTIENGLTVRAVRTLDVKEFPFYNGYSMETYTWDDILERDANPRVLHEGWDGK